MKHFSEISLIATVSFIGELLHYLIPLPVPSSIYGLLLMLLLLVTHIVKLDHVKTTAESAACAGHKLRKNEVDAFRHGFARTEVAV